MSFITREFGETSVVFRAKLLDSSSTTGAGLIGLDENTVGLQISAMANNEATDTVYSVAAGTIMPIVTLGAFSTIAAGTCQFGEVAPSSKPGIYEFHFADARFAVAGAKSLLVSVNGATNLAEFDGLVELFTKTAIDSNGYVTLADGSLVAAKFAADCLAASNLADSILSSEHITAAFANKIADHLIRRNMETARAGTDGDAIQKYSAYDALCKLTSKVTRVGSSLTVYDTQAVPVSLFTQTIVATAGVDPITSVTTD